MSTAALFGGIGMEILMYRSKLSIALEDADRHFAAARAELRKLASPELVKSFGSLDLDKAAAPVLAALEGTTEALRRANASFGEWAGFINTRHPVYEVYLADKAYDALSAAGGRDAALQAGALVPFGPRRTPTPDPTQNLGSTYLTRRTDI